MRCPKMLRDLLLALVWTCSAAPAPAAQEALLTVWSAPGTRATLDFNLSFAMGLSDGAGREERIEVEMRMGQSSVAERRSESGHTVWRMQPTYMRTVMNGETAMDVDLRDPEFVDAARAAPGGEMIDKLLSLVVRGEQALDGSIVDFQVEGGDEQMRAQLERMFEDRIAQHYILFPSHPIKVGESWLAGKRSFHFAGFGRIDYQLAPTLAGVSGGRARFHLTARDARWTPDSEGEATELVSFAMEGEMQFDLDRHYVISQRNHGQLSLRQSAYHLKVDFQLDLEDER